jgi:hypothetical protein
MTRLKTNAGAVAGLQYTSAGYLEMLRSWQVGSITDGQKPWEAGRGADVFVFSHRRSGTHLTVNMLRYAFPGLRVWKMNHASCGNCTLMNLLYRNGGRVVHAYRDPKDMAVSLYKYSQALRGARGARLNETFAAFLTRSNAGKLWKVYTDQCLRLPHALHISFEITRSRLNETLEAASRFLGHPITHHIENVPATSAVNFDGGDTNSWRNFFTNETLRLLYDQIFIGESLGNAMPACPCEHGAWAAERGLGSMAPCLANATLYM